MCTQAAFRSQSLSGCLFSSRGLQLLIVSWRLNPGALISSFADWEGATRDVSSDESRQGD